MFNHLFCFVLIYISINKKVRYTYAAQSFCIINILKIKKIKYSEGNILIPEKQYDTNNT